VNLDDPIATALRVAEALDRAGVRYALFGGLLLAAYGDPRETRDVDLAVIDVSAAEARRALETAGLTGTVSFEAVTFGGLSISRLALVGGDADTGLNVLDLVQARSARYRTGAQARSVTAPLRGRTIRALSADDFVIFKALATRERDVDDAASVLKRSEILLDLGLIEREVGLLAAEIPDWDVRARWNLIRARRS
jgi:predicted nucleotidyltransferase